MATIVTMPRYGANMEEGTIAAWMVSQGDAVESGDVIAEIATEKLSNELEAPAGGIVLKLLAEEEETLPCGAPIAVLGEEGEEIPPLSGDQPAPEESPGEAGKAPPEEPAGAGASAGDDAFAVVEMPRYGANMEEGTIAAWFVAEGDTVEFEDPLGEIAIEKLSNELLAPRGGVVRKLLAEVEETLPCGAPIAVIGEAQGDYGPALARYQGQTEAEMPAKEDAPREESRAQAAGDGPAPEAPGITPRAQKWAEEQGVDVRSIPAGTGRHGMITIEDVKAWAEKAPAVPLAEEPATSVRLTPKARAYAEEQGIDPAGIPGTGRHGMVTREDLKGALASGTARKIQEKTGGIAPAPMPVSRKAMTPMQKVIAASMLESMQTTAQTTQIRDLDVGEMVDTYRARKEEYARRGVKLTYTAILLRAVALALTRHPEFRTRMEDGEFVVLDQVNVGVAVDVEGGLIVPNIKATHTKSVETIARELAELAGRARQGRLVQEELEGGTFTVTNLGMFGIRCFTPVLNRPENGILGVGALQEVPVVRDKGLFVRPMMTLSLTHDHRIVNGAPAARFLQTLQELLEQAGELVPAGGGN